MFGRVVPADFSALVNEVESFDPCNPSDSADPRCQTRSRDSFLSFNVVQFAKKLGGLLVLNATADAIDHALPNLEYEIARTRSLRF
jgi:hypothetical protein